MLKAPLLTVATLLLVATDLAAPLVPVEFDAWRWAVSQGGLTLVILAVLWFYRRDFLGDRKESREQLQVLTDLVKANTVAMTETRDAIARQTDAEHRLAHAVERLERAG